MNLVELSNKVEERMELLIVVGKTNCLEYQELDKEYDTLKELIMLDEQGLL